MTKRSLFLPLGALLGLLGLAAGCDPSTGFPAPEMEAGGPEEQPAPGDLFVVEDDREDEEASAPVPPAPEPVTPEEPNEPSSLVQPMLAAVDSDGVVMLATPKVGGSSWSLGARDPNTVDPTYFDLNGDTATRATQNGITYWTTTGHKVSYASGAPDGRTIRLNIKASGGGQKYTWTHGAPTNGYIANPKDLRNLEATAYVRVRGHNGTHTSMSWKLRGGKHSSSNGALSSCTGMSVPYGGRPAQGYRELNHPNYDYVSLASKFPYQLQEGKWLAVKILSYVVGNGTRNFLYLDTDPFDAAGKPRNNFRLYSEWTDENGKSTGRYKQAATWGGWLTTFRVDGWRNLDFAILSAREIVPPAS